MLQHATAASNMRHRSGEASPIVAGSVVFAAVSLVVHGCEVAPSLARRMCNHRQIAVVVPRVPIFRPRIHEWKIGVASIRLDE